MDYERHVRREINLIFSAGKEVNCVNFVMSGIQCFGKYIT